MANEYDRFSKTSTGGNVAASDLSNVGNNADETGWEHPSADGYAATETAKITVGGDSLAKNQDPESVIPDDAMKRLGGGLFDMMRFDNTRQPNPAAAKATNWEHPKS